MRRLVPQPSSPAKAGDPVIAIAHMGQERNDRLTIVAVAELA
jgi:poly-gamma-glutamate capsule biosynthesis protein CapA/YwtB (metallophosphatase superfamily)